MSTEPANGRISVSEDRLRALFAEFKVDLLRELNNYVNTTTFAALEAQVSELRLWRAGLTGQIAARRQVSASTLAWASLAVAALTALATVVWLTHS